MNDSVKDRFVTVEQLIEDLGITEAELEMHRPLARAAIEAMKRDGPDVEDITEWARRLSADLVPYREKPEEKD